MRQSICLLFAAASLLAGRWLTPARAEEPAVDKNPKQAAGQEKEQPKKEAERHYLRLTRDAQGDPTALQTSIVRFVAKDGAHAGLEVELVSAVHIGEKAYYTELNKDFEHYDALLYELVAPEGTKIPKGGKASDNPLSMLQNGMKSMLGLEYQLAEIDYTKKNFVHADMSPEQFAKSMEARGESFWTIFMQMMAQGMAKQGQQVGKADESDLLLALFDKNRALLLKRIVAEQFEDLEGSMQMFDGPKGSTLITERNKAALAVLRTEIDKGEKKIGIFYGAGHMTDMSARLEKEFGLKRADERWLTAWNLARPVAALPAARPKQ